MAKQPSSSFEQPGLMPLGGLSPVSPLRRDDIIRLELLRIVWRPDRDAALAIKAASELETYVLCGKALE